MKKMKIQKKIAILILTLIMNTNAFAFFFFFPIPNFAKPPQLQKIIDALETSDETKAVAFVSENKSFGTKQWIWGNIAGEMTQEEADKQALMVCDKGLQKAKNEKVGGKPLYDFETKQCELYEFKNKSVKLPTNGQAKISSSSQQISASQIENNSSALTEKIKLFKFPLGWVDNPISDNLKNSGSFLFKTNKTIDTGLLFTATNKNQITDVKIFTQTSKNTLEGVLDAPKSSEITQVIISDEKLIEFTVIGNLKTGSKLQVKYLRMFLELENQIITITLWSGATNFDFHRTEYDTLMKNLIVYLKGKENIEETNPYPDKSKITEIPERCKALGFQENTNQYQLCINELSK